MCQGYSAEWECKDCKVKVCDHCITVCHTDCRDVVRGGGGNCQCKSVSAGQGKVCTLP